MSPRGQTGNPKQASGFSLGEGMPRKKQISNRMDT